MGFIKCYSWNQTFGFVVGLQGAYNGRDPCPATGSWLMLMCKPKFCKGKLNHVKNAHQFYSCLEKLSNCHIALILRLQEYYHIDILIMPMFL